MMMYPRRNTFHIRRVITTRIKKNEKGYHSFRMQHFFGKVFCSPFENKVEIESVKIFEKTLNRQNLISDDKRQSKSAYRYSI